ncbi:MAG: sialate O-acetylesterase [Bacteroidetes bacterium]|nr:sialate O-acetylesterase [Bacteroidota bacterium]
MLAAKKWFVLLSAVIILPAVVIAKPVLPSFFSDGMILQQQTNAALWGWAKANGKVMVNTSWNKKSYNAIADAHGKWNIKVATPAAGGPYSITVSDGETVTIKNILIGEVWLCSGQSNMEMPMKGFKDQPIYSSNDAIFNSTNEQIRIYTVPRAVERQTKDTTKSSSWKMCTPENISNFSATAYYFGRLLQQQLKIPVALILNSYSGSPAEAFMSAASLQAFPEINIPAANGTEKLNNKNATTLYNGMIHPFAGYTIKGCIWYQGESNYDRPDQYEKLFPAMVQLWRQEWGQGDFPFYFAQIAPYAYSSLPSNNRSEKLNSAYLRDAQRKAVKAIPNSGMVVLLDAGDEKTIHPFNKEIAGKRFAYMALGELYQFKGFAYQSPLFDTMRVSGNVATISFKNAPNGLTSYTKPLTQFEIAGADKNFYPAQAIISKGTVLVSSPQVPAPVAVRYAFRDFIVGELFSVEGYPVSSFRTDEW